MILLLSFFKLNGQTYCTPTTGGISTSYYLANAIFSDQGAFYYNAASYQAYVNNSTTQTVTSYPGGTVKIHLDFVGSGTKALVWVDWDGNGDFNGFYENPIAISAYSVVDDQFYVPPTQTPGTYRIRVQTGTSLNGTPNPCGPNTNGNGNFVDFSLKIDPTPTCFVPTAVTASNITNAAATISWTAPATGTPSGYEYYYTSSTTVPDASTPASGSTASSSAPISSLTSFTTYYVYVRTVCGASKTAWSLRGIFKTKCDPMTSMFENFDNVATGALNADCWDKIVLGTGTQSISSSAGVNSTKGMFQYSNGAANTVIAILPVFSNVNAGTHWLRFKARLSGTTIGAMDIGYLTNDTDATTFVNIQSVTISNTVYDGYEYSVVIPNTIPANARLAIRHNGAPAASFYWDNIYWEPKPTCMAPTNIALSNITSATIDVAWTAPASLPAAGYDIYYTTSNVPPTSTTSPSITGVTANPYTIQGLSSATTYYIWVRSRCSATDQSLWTNITSALTLCAPKTSLLENFDAYATGALTPNAPCWGRVQTGLGSTNINGNGALSGTRHLLQRSISAGDVTIAILPELSNINAGTHSLTFNAYCSVATTGKLDVGYITNPADANTFTVIQQVSIPNTSYTPTTGTSEYSVVIPNTVPAGAKLAIRNSFATSGNAQYFWDNISWAPTVVLGVNEVAKKQDVAIYPNPFTDVVTISGAAQLQSVSVYDASGKMVKEIKSSEKTVSLHNLNSGIYMIKLTMKNGTSTTIKAIKK